MADLKKVIGDSHQVLVDGTRNSGNYYQAWPFLAYLFYNPDATPGLGVTVFPDVWNKYKKNSGETPLHVLDRLVSEGGKGRIQDVVGRYWARMAFVDVGHAKMQALFNTQRRDIKYANLDTAAGGTGRYRVKTARQPRYMGANIVPLKASGGTLGVNVTVASGAPFVATLAVKGAGGSVRYVELPRGSGQTTVASGEEAMLVVVNTPATLYMYDPFSISREAGQGLDYQVQLTGATAV